MKLIRVFERKVGNRSISYSYYLFKDGRIKEVLLNTKDSKIGVVGTSFVNSISEIILGAKRIERKV